MTLSRLYSAKSGTHSGVTQTAIQAGSGSLLRTDCYSTGSDAVKMLVGHCWSALDWNSSSVATHSGGTQTAFQAGSIGLTDRDRPEPYVDGMKTQRIGGRRVPCAVLLG